MATIGDPGIPTRSRPDLRSVEEHTVTAYPGSFLLAGLMWTAWTVASFLIMFGLIAPTYGNVFIVFLFLMVAILASMVGRGERE